MTYFTMKDSIFFCFTDRHQRTNDKSKV